MKKDQVNDLILQMAHDIRSPLTALLAVIMSPGDLNERKRSLALLATQRVQDIADRILEGYKCTATSSQKVSVTTLITQLVEEKLEIMPGDIKLQFKFENTQNKFIDCTRAKDLQRIISNLINNSIDALKYKMEPKILVTVRRHNRGKLKIIIEDNGCGISNDKIRKIGTKGYTQKLRGNGLGIYFAKEILKTWNGQLKIRSKAGCGTKMILVF